MLRSLKELQGFVFLFLLINFSIFQQTPNPTFKSQRPEIGSVQSISGTHKVVSCNFCVKGNKTTSCQKPFTDQLWFQEWILYLR